MQNTEIIASRLSMQQARLWSLQGWNPAYQSWCVLSLKGQLDRRTFLKAVQYSAKRHEILHTLFRPLPGTDVPVQVVIHGESCFYALSDWQRIAPADQRAECDRLLAHLQQKTYDLEHGPLLSIWLLQLASDEHMLLLHLPALCADAFTLKILVEELLRAYTERSWSVESDDDPLQYADVSAWQEDLLLEEDAEPHRRYWHRIDVSHLSSSYVPFTRQVSVSNQAVEREQLTSFIPERFNVPLEEDFYARIRLLSQQLHVSLPAIFLACWKLLLWRLGSEPDAIIGAACDGRIHEELRTASGLYTRFVPINTYFEGSYFIEQILVAIDRSLQEAIERQAYFSWEPGIAATNSQVNAQFFPLSFEYNTWPAYQATDSLSTSLYEWYSCTECFLLKLNVLEVGNSFRLALHFDPHHIQISHVARLASMLNTLLRHMLSDPYASLPTHPLLPPAEITALCSLSSTPSSPLPVSALHHLFERQVRSFPHLLAARDAYSAISYQQLNAQANRLARVLRSHGATASQPIGLCLPRGLPMLVGLLAILKAGAAYLPLDPQNPPARLLFHLQQAHVSLVLTRQSLLPLLSSWSGCCLCLEQIQPLLQQEDESNLDLPIDPGALAYVLYTSGSTGQPKGVYVSHRGLVNYLQALADRLDAQPGWTYATVSTIAADLGNTALFGALTTGGCVHLLDYETSTSPQTLARWAEQQAIDVLKIVPSHLSALLSGTSAAPFLPRRALILGGEVLSGELAARVRALNSSCRIFNHYGPTETTIGVLMYELSSQHPGDPVPLGNPLAGCECYVLDQGLHLLPPGVVGELYLGGAGLAWGYMGQPALTAERFLPHPWSQQPGARLYRTGDRGYWGPAGSIVYMGRGDRQVKLRGYRVELGEIEALLRRMEEVREAAVTLEQGETGQPRLVGYVVCRKPAAVSTQILEEQLSRQLPEYMVPGEWVVLEHMPLTRNGKIDWQALSSLLREQNTPRARTADALTPMQELVQQLWQEVLGVEPIAVDENFFELGGHSLLATQLLARLQAMVGVEISILSLFEAPTIAGLTEKIETVVRGGQNEIPVPLVRQPGGQELPLSFAQQRLWFLNQLEPANTSYNKLDATVLRGPLQPMALEKSLKDIVRRHEILRTVFQVRANRPVQVIHEIAAFQMPSVDLRGLRPEEREVEAQNLAEQSAERPFDLVQGPLLRVHLLHLEEQVHVLVLTLHHIISDGWSNGLLLRELTELYRAARSGQPATLPPLPIQYADFALWQRQWLQGQVLEAQVAYWQQQLAGVVPLELPLDRPRPAIVSARGASQSLLLPASLQEQLLALSRQENVTLFMLLLAAFQVLLWHYTGQQDLSVGTPIANRPRQELHHLIGFFVNTLVLRTNLAGNPPFTHLLQRVREVALGAYAHQDVPFEYLVERLQPERHLNRSPFFQVSFNFQQMASITEDVAGLTLSRVNVERPISRFDLTFTVISNAQGLHCFVEYSTDLFEATTIRRWLEHWQKLLVDIVKHPTARLAELPMLTDEEARLLLIESNATVAALPREIVSLCQLFEQQVWQMPDKIALIYKEQQLTYAQLDRSANQLAHYLQMLGIEPEVVVGVYLPRSLEMVVALLGTLKAGGAYVPLDSSLPQERLSFLLADAGVAILLTSQELAMSLSGSLEPPVQIICLDQEWNHLRERSEEPPLLRISGKMLAYIIYTSGSTGVPKGAMITHRGLLNYGCWAAKHYEADRGNGSIVQSSIGFDLTITSLFLPLVNGRHVCLVPEEQGIEGLVSLIRQSGDLSLLKITPAHMDSLDQYLSADELSEAARALVIGGEALTFERVSTWRRYAPQTRLINEYGPTETVVGCCIYEVAQGDAETGVVPIGSPIANTQLYIVDEYMYPVPIGRVGELYIGGEGLARGYLRRPDLTAERFVPNPFAEDRGMRLYKSGDMARYRADGTIEYVGRQDGQVKLRGYRIELGEIESVLRQHRAVHDAVVLLRADTRGTPCLVGYVVTQQEEENQRVPVPTNEQLADFLRTYLPEYMIPAAFVQLEAWPLTENGKVDRHRLPDPEIKPDTSDRAGAEPKHPIEEMLLELWRELLGVPLLGIHDNFFAMGGHSLLAIRLIARIRSVFHVEMPIRSLFESPTIATLAKRIEQALGNEIDRTALALMPVSHEGFVPLSFAQQRLWFLEQLDPGSPVYLIPACLRLHGSLERAALQRSLDALLERQQSLRTCFPLQAEQPVQQIHPAGSCSLPLLDLRGLEEDQREREAERLLAQEVQRPFDLAQGPLLRVHLLHLEEQVHVLVLTLHHIISDGWSNGLLLRELTELYRAARSGQPATLPPLPIQYADFALWQRQWLQGQVLEAQVAYWQRQLAHSVPLELPTDSPRSSIQTFRGGYLATVLPPALQDELIALSRQENVTLFMLLLAAFQVLLWHYTGQRDLSVGTPIANRPRQELHHLIGFFVNTLVLRTNLAGNPPFTHLLQRVREVALGAYAHQDVPFEYLVERLQPERHLNRSPFFQVMFGLHHASSTPARFEGLELQPFAVEHHTSKFDLTFNMVQQPDGLHCGLEYRTELFAPQTITRLLQQWHTLLQHIVAAPTTPLANLRLLPEEQIAHLLQLAGPTRQPELPSAVLPDLLGQRVAGQPDAIALASEQEGSLSYAHLARRVRQLAGRLRQEGVGQEERVAVLLPRSLAWILTLLAILQAGGTYLPLDPSMPGERLRAIVKEAGARLLVGASALLPAELREQGVRVCCWEELAVTRAGQQPEQPLPGPLAAEQAAYVIFTSGSTGTPKGVVIAHQGLGTLAAAQAQAFALGPASRVVQFASASFDASLAEVLVSLLAGACLVLAPAEDLAPGPSLLRQLRRWGISVLTLPPSVLRVLEPEELPELATLVVAGEVCHREEVARWAPGRRMCNAYGPSEATVCASIAVGLSEQEESDPPIGWPMPNVQVYVVNAQGELAPQGVVGELYLGGSGVGRGYLGRAEETAERFVPDGWSGQAGARLYRSGDRGRYRADGQLEYVGRQDGQVKLRGYRIEVGEIEAVLLRHPGIEEAVVRVWETEGGERHLVGYMSGPEELEEQEVRRWVERSVPEYMVPSWLVQLEQWPRLPSGKIDRRALPSPVKWQEEQSGELVPPRNLLETQLAELWCEVLGRSQVSIYDNFFKIGGHSLLAARLVVRIYSLFQVEIPVRRLFEEPTIAGLARVIEETQILLLEQTRSEELAQMLSMLEGLSENEGSVNAYFGTVGSDEKEEAR